jgi:hypothetical protein
MRDNPFIEDYTKHKPKKLQITHIHAQDNIVTQVQHSLAN